MVSLWRAKKEGRRFFFVFELSDDLFITLKLHSIKELERFFIYSFHLKNCDVLVKINKKSQFNKKKKLYEKLYSNEDENMSNSLSS